MIRLSLTMDVYINKRWIIYSSFVFHERLITTQSMYPFGSVLCERRDIELLRNKNSYLKIV